MYDFGGASFENHPNDGRILPSHKVDHVVVRGAGVGPNMIQQTEKKLRGAVRFS
jgi:hypothetical protein